MRRHCNRLRNKICCNAPRSVADVEREFDKVAIMDRFGYTCGSNRQEMYVGCIRNARIQAVFFKSQRMINVMNTCTERKFFVDATFRVVPNGDFQQLLVIHVEMKDHVSNSCIIKYKIICLRCSEHILITKKRSRNTCII